MLGISHENVCLGLVKKTRRVVTENADSQIRLECSKILRGILFAANQDDSRLDMGANILTTAPGTDLLFPQIEYPFVSRAELGNFSFLREGNYDDGFVETKIEICDCTSLAPLLNYIGMNRDMSVGDLQKLCYDFLLNRSWLLENKQLFGYDGLGYANFLGLKYTFEGWNDKKGSGILPESIAKTIISVQQSSCFRPLSKKLNPTRSELKYYRYDR